jgi:hypothetical protein
MAARKMRNRMLCLCLTLAWPLAARAQNVANPAADLAADRAADMASARGSIVAPENSKGGDWRDVNLEAPNVAAGDSTPFSVISQNGVNQNGGSQNGSTAPQSAPSADSPNTDSSNETPVTMFPHSETARYWISGQANIVSQWHPAFPAAYSGPNSFGPQGQNATSRVYTLYTGYQLTESTEVFADIESAGGRGLSNALGLAGFTNLDVVRNPQLGASPYLARLMIRQIIPLSDEKVAAQRGPLELATTLPARRIEIRFGKFGLVDFLDPNTGGTDSHLQFLNWTVDNNGGYDYAANTRGYTDGVLVEYDDHRFSARFAETLMPKVANGTFLDADIARARAENFEVDYGRNFLPGRAGVVRFLTYVNHGNMGDYRQAIDNFLNGEGTRPDITTTRQQGRIKYGFGVNVEQQLLAHLQFFGRWGWNEGHHESFAYTEVNEALELGAAFTDIPRRKNDHAGFAWSQNAISGDHREYLALGGLGFLLGDGALDYAKEEIVEGYYTLHVWRGAFASFDLQRVWNPGYNQARGPVIVPSLRAHLDF